MRPIETDKQLVAEQIALEVERLKQFGADKELIDEFERTSLSDLQKNLDE